MKTFIFSARGLLLIVTLWNKDEQNIGARATAGNSLCEITPDGIRRARAGMKAKMEMRRSWRWGSFAGDESRWLAMAVDWDGCEVVFTVIDFEMYGKVG